MGRERHTHHVVETTPACLHVGHVHHGVESVGVVPVHVLEASVGAVKVGSILVLVYILAFSILLLLFLAVFDILVFTFGGLYDGVCVYD